MEDKEFIQKIQDEITSLEKEYGLKPPQAFVFWGLFNLFGLDETDAQNAGDVGGAGDKSVDAIWIDDDESKCFILQGKLQLKGSKSVSREVISDLLHAPNRLESETIMTSKSVNKTLKDRAREYRDAIEKGYETELILLTTGKVAPNALDDVKQYNMDYDDRAVFIYDLESLKKLYVERLTQISEDPVNTTLDLIGGKYFEFDINSQRSIVFTVSGNQLACLAANYGFALFEQNVRFELSRKKVNKGILETLSNSDESQYFWWYNNGISMICDDFTIDETKTRVEIKGLQIVNGCQTTMTLKRALNEVSLKIQPCVKILARLTIPEDKTLAEKIAEYNNSQTEVIPRDFRANDAIQIRLQKEFERKSFLYIRKRGEKETLSLSERRRKRIIDMEKLAQVLFAFYHDKPSEAKAEKAKLFDKKHPYYKTIFHSNLAAEDCILPFLIREDISTRQTELRRLRNQLRKDNIENTDPQWEQFNSNEFILHSDFHILSAVKHLIALKYKKIDSPILGNVRRSENCSGITDSLIKMAIRAINRLVRQAESGPGFSLTKFFKSEDASQSVAIIIRDLNNEARDLYSKKSLVEDIPWP